MAWVQSPVFVQFVLPDRTRCGLPAEIAHDDELVVGKMAVPHQAVMQVNLAAQLRTHRAVFVRFLRIEGAVGEDEMAFLAERNEGRDQFRIVQFIERGVNLAAVLFDVGEQIEQLLAQETAQRIAQRVAALPDQSVELGALADACERPRHPLRRDDALVEIGGDVRRRLARNRHRRRLGAGVSL